MTADEIVRLLSLQPHPEGGAYAEVFRSGRPIESSAHEGARSAATSIYFLLRTGEFSALHRVTSDEMWHHYAGDPLTLHALDVDGAVTHRLGPNLASGERPFAVIPAGVYQAARPQPGTHGYALCGCTVAPGFEFRDFEMPTRAELHARFPRQRSLIDSLTRA